MMRDIYLYIYDATHIYIYMMRSDMMYHAHDV